jgi:hypothetical protein
MSFPSQLVKEASQRHELQRSEYLHGMLHSYSREMLLFGDQVFTVRHDASVALCVGSRIAHTPAQGRFRRVAASKCACGAVCS